MVRSSIRLLSMSNECLKSRCVEIIGRIHNYNFEYLFSKTWNEKPLIRQSIESFRAGFWSRLHVLLLLIYHLSLDFNFEA